MSPPGIRAPGELPILQGGRAVAALAVVLYHLSGAFFADPQYFGRPFFSGFGFGYAGVEFFFVLSGFIILHVHRRDVGRPGTVRPFAWKRFRRVYLPLWVVLIGLVGLYALAPGLGSAGDRDPGAILAAFTLWPTRTQPLLAVAWTLQHEVLFYALFAVLLVSRRAGLLVLGAWFAACAAGAALALAGFALPFPLSFLCSPYNLLFFLGMAVSLSWSAQPVARPLTLVIGGVALFLAVGLQDVYAATPLPDAFRTVAFGIAAAAATLGLLGLEEAGRLGTPAVLRRLGDASYSLYLSHVPVLSAGCKLLFASGLAAVLPRGASFALLLVMAVAAAMAFHLLVEKPLLRLRLRPRRAPAAEARDAAIPGRSPASSPTS